MYPHHLLWLISIIKRINVPTNLSCLTAPRVIGSYRITTDTWHGRLLCAKNGHSNLNRRIIEFYSTRYRVRWTS